MQVDGEEDRPARAEAEALLRAGRLFEARCTAQDALDADGPDAWLYLVEPCGHSASIGRMAMFVHLTPTAYAARIRRSGIRTVSHGRD
ncbi:hypothetical protein [Streptomyces sp. LN500]|uniref:hypothetical protein n=1 Tax=Streptomyces sp. LN500 TaxID=3112978 RepID=UPI0037187C13